MKIVVLGGAGDMGSRTVEDLAATPGVARVTVADRNEAGARALAHRLRGAGARVEAEPVDAHDHAALVGILRDHDVAASALGPFHRFEAPLVRASIDAGTDYVSICDEWEAAEEVLVREHDAARRAGVTVVTGLGASPGLTNVAVRYLSERFDRVRGADVYCFQPLDAGGGEAVYKHMLFIMTGDVAVWRGGRRTMVPACSESRVVDFPRFGPLRLWNMGHSEPYTLPRAFAGLEEVGFWMGYGPGSKVFVQPARWGWFSSARRVDAFATLIDLVESLLPAHDPGIGALRVDVWGDRDGAEAREIVCGTGQMRDTTGLALSIGALAMARGELLTREGGVYAPEDCIRPGPFIESLRAKGIAAFHDVGMTRPLEPTRA